MQMLPREISCQIFSYIPCHDLLRLRLVSKWFDEHISYQLNTFSSMRLIRRQFETEEPDLLTYRFNFNEFKMYVENGPHLSHNLSLVKSKFAGLQAIDLYDTLEAVTLSSLIPFACHLKYIRAYQIIVDVSHNSVQDIMDMFPALQAFDVVVASELFCQGMWARRSNFVQWSNKCDHYMPCENAFDPPTAETRCMKLFIFSPKRLNLTTFSSSLEALILMDPVAAPPVLHLPNLKFFKLATTRYDIESHTFYNYLGNAPDVRSIFISFIYVRDLTLLSCLSLVNSRPKLEKFHVGTEVIIETDDSEEPMTFAGCEKRRLRHISVSITECSSDHLAIIKSLLNSCGSPLNLFLETGLCNIELKYQPELAEIYQNHFGHGSITIKWNDSAMSKQFLAILAPLSLLAVTFLDITLGEAVDASFVEAILQFKNLEILSGGFTEEFITSWLPLFTLSDNKKNLEIEFSKSHLPTRSVHDSLLEAMDNGSLERISGEWLCPIEATCACGLTKP